MKILKKIIFAIIVISLSLILVSCSFNLTDKIKDILENTVWNYSNEGENEIKMNFSALTSETYKGIFEWNITVNKNGNSSTFNLKYYADKSGEIKKEKFIYEKGDTKLVRLKLGDDVYYIDETNKTVNYDSEIFAAAAQPMIYAAKYGIIELENKNAEKQWTFIGKKDSVSVINSEGASEDSIEYEYSSVEEQGSTNSTKMLINFRKVITPLIARIYYEVYSNNVLSEKITVYTILHTEEITDSVFVVPTAQEGYTVEEPPAQ